MQEQKSTYYDRHKDIILAQRKEYYQANKERIDNYNCIYARNHPDKIKAIKRKYYITHHNPEQKREYYQLNKEHIKEYQRQYRDKKKLND